MDGRDTWTPGWCGLEHEIISTRRICCHDADGCADVDAVGKFLCTYALQGH